MIKKISEIKNFAVFKNFDWDKETKNEKGQVIDFSHINFLYGRNYSGKTTLSRIFRAIETDDKLEKYKQGSFNLKLYDGTDFNATDLIKFPYKVRVFNEDFTKDKLLFINNPESGVAPFAVLGNNANIEREIQKIKNELGSNIEKEETGLYLERVKANTDWNEANNRLKKAEKDLSDILSKKATEKEYGIKHCSDYGDINYNISKLKTELNEVSSQNLLSAADATKLRSEIQEKPKSIPTTTENNYPNFEEINKLAKSIVEKPIVEEGKITELVSNAMANKWVEEGCDLHREKESCFFCGGKITKDRWSALERHYDESTKTLQKDLEVASDEINKTIKSIEELYILNKNDYFLEFHKEIGEIEQEMSSIRQECTVILNKVLEQIEKRQKEIHIQHQYTEHFFDTNKIKNIYNKIQSLNKRANEYSKTLSTKQDENKKKLRLSEIARFKEEIGYTNRIDEIEKEKKVVLDKKTIKEEKDNKIKLLEDQIKSKERQRQNEEEGAVKVNNIIKNHFGHQSIELRAVKKEGEEGIFFDVFRQDEKAYNLSEGERNLIAFAYFVAKLEDIQTISEKPIIWIDDPISSLDANHTFFMFSLIDQQIISKNNWTQIFISTHSLDFLRYLKRIHEPKGYSRRWFLIERCENNSSIIDMPKYMKEHVTEFNYLFHQIYKCSEDKNTNNDVFYNFGNNARKFLEAYLYYRYPDNEKNSIRDKLKLFFDDEKAATTIDRIDNELSHLEGLIERGMSILEYPEIKKCAKFILNTIKQKDPEQYNAFLRSIKTNNVNSI